MRPPILTPPDSPISSCSELRRQLRELRVERKPNLHPDKWIFPQNSVRRLFTEECVRTLLECRCDRCAYHKRIQEVTDPATYVSHILGLRSFGRIGDGTSVVLLALLLFIECPAMIFGFLRSRCGDQQFQTQVASFTSAFVRKNYWHKFSTSEVEEYAEKFHWARYQFAIPCVEGSQYEEYRPLEILPFIEERRLGNGHFGEVYAFDIIDGYYNFPVRRSQDQKHPKISCSDIFELGISRFESICSKRTQTKYHRG